MVTNALIPKLQIGVGNYRFPVFTGAGVITVSTEMQNTDPDFQVILNSTATCTQMAGPIVKLPKPIQYIFTGKPQAVAYSYPEASITTEECIESIKHIRSLPHPPHLVDKTKQRNIILNYDFNNHEVTSKCRNLITENINSIYALELSVNHIPKDPVKINKYIADLKKYIKRPIWLKTPRPIDLDDASFIDKINAPTALVIGHGLPAKYDKLEVFNAEKPTMASGTYLYPSTLATIQLAKPFLKVPLIVGGGIRTISDIQEVIKNGASAVQITSSGVIRWMTLVGLHNKLKKDKTFR